MPSTQTILLAINSTDHITWSQFVHALPDRPHAYTDKSAWRAIFNSLEALEGMELIVIERDRNSNEVISLVLTDLGMERLLESAESDRLAIERRKKRIEMDRLGGMRTRTRGAHGLG